MSMKAIVTRFGTALMIAAPLFPALAQEPGIRGPLFQSMQVSAAVDLLQPVYFDEASTEKNRLNIRAAEMVIYGPIDHIFDGVLNFAGHTEEEEGFIFEAHEAYIASSKLIPRSRFKVGRFFLGVGRLNQYHQHDWPFVSAPKVQREFFNPGRNELEVESAVDNGLEFSFLVPTTQFIDLTFGVTNGYCYGHCHDENLQKPQVPTHYVRASTFFDMGEGAGLLLGSNYLGRTDDAGNSRALLGLDATYKRRTGRILNWLMQSELWYQTLDDGGLTQLGGYFYPQKGLSETWSLGVRFDGFSQLNRTFDTDGSDRPNFDYAIVPTLTWHPSEFSRMRLAYTHEVATQKGDSDNQETRLELQFTYLLGAHPAHDF
jgi:hypothetical protein